MNWIEQAIITIVTAVAAYIGGGWYQKRKAKAAAESQEITNRMSLVDYSDKILQTWQKGFEDLEKLYTTKYDVLYKQYAEITVKYENAQKEIEKLKSILENNTIQGDIDKLQKKVKALECENANLKKEIHKLKAGQ